MANKNWQTWADDTDFKEGREISPGVWQVIEVTDMNEACGAENEGRPQFVGELSLVDLNVLGPEKQKEAWASCGWGVLHQLIVPEPAQAAEACHSYGCRAPLDSIESNGRTVARRAMRSAAKLYKNDPRELAEALERPVNQIGSTASEFMRGDLDSAITRGVANGDPAAKILAKMQDAATRS